jgi:CheY-like chemotaxis protein
MQQAKAQGHPFPLVLSDGHMPELDGFSLVQKIKEDPSLASATLMMLTSSDQKQDREFCQQLGVAGYMIKPIRPSELLDAILRAMGKETSKKRRTTDPFSLKARRALRLLVAEDNTVNQKLAVRFLQKWGHEAVLAGNGKEVCEILENEGPFNAILMDVEMPQMDGLEATAAIRQQELAEERSRIPIIAMTAHAMVGDKDRCLEAGMDSYISKPLKAEELFEILEHVAADLQGETPFPEEDVPIEEIFDRTELATLLDGDANLLTELMDLFWENCPKLLAELQQAITVKDAQHLTYTAHALKGSVGNFSARRTLAAVTEIEQIGRQGDFLRAQDALAKVETELSRLKPALVSFQQELTTNKSLSL